MICPICHASGATYHRDPSGAFVDCPSCLRRILQHPWVCPTCASTQGEPRIRNNRIEIECQQCHTRDEYIEPAKVV